MRVQFSFPDNTQAGVFEIPATAVISKYDASWIFRPNGEKIRVINLGTAAANGTILITGDLLETGQRYLLHPEPTESVRLK